MSRKAKGPSSETELQPITGGQPDLLLVIIAALVVVLVGLLFQLNVNRVFDVPKALVLKVGGCGIFLFWLLYGLFGGGWPQKSLKIFGAPVAALTAAVILSTFLSIDVPMSMSGVYERQFGLQGFLGCIGLFVVTATCLRSRRGAFAALSVLAVVGGAIGTYSFLQAIGMDPFGFFTKPHNKTYSFLGNATFAGNALALIFPMSAVIAVIAWVKTVVTAEGNRVPLWGAFGLGLAAVSGLQICSGLWLVYRFGAGKDTAESAFQFFMFVSLCLPLIAGLAGSWGPSWSRAASAEMRRLIDAYGAGTLVSAVVGIMFGVACTRTRGAWVGSAIAVFLGAILLPIAFKDLRVRIVAWTTLAVIILGPTAFIVAKPNHIWSTTIKSIPKAFDRQREVVGRGQGTRPYLWAESPRVLFNHGDTLERVYEDERERAERTNADEIKDLDLNVEARSHAAQATDKSWRRLQVWLSGIGIETYRYAFMSHKSKKLESLDPMTNHDNPHNNYLYVLASFGILGFVAYVWLLWRLLSVAFRKFIRDDDDLVTRTVAFGVITSFFSYAVYSIAGFDSVACSVFFYFFLGSAAVYFEPSTDEPRKKLLPMASNAPRAILAVVLGGLLIYSIGGAIEVYRAERAFVGERKRDLLQKIEDIKTSIRINPDESYYKQMLGGAYVDASRQRRQHAQRFAQAGKTAEAASAKKAADEFSRKAETALYAALDHAWAPENVFISLFQLYYSWGRYEEAEHALERALEHSPHLGAVRANLAVLKIERRDYEAALKDCLWVLEVDPSNAVGLRTCGRASFFLNKPEDAKRYFDRGLAVAPNDNVLKQYVADMNAAKTSSAGR